MSTDSSIVFAETQRLLPNWIRALVVVLSVMLVLLIGYSFYQQQVTGGTVLGILAGGAFLALLWSAKLVSEVREDDFYVRYSPFHWSYKRLPLKDVTEVESKTYSPVKNYGGWGIRCGRDGSRAYTVRGNQGVMLKFVDGKSLLVGSQQPDRLHEAIRSVWRAP
jgi:hypothetical protein